MLSLSSLGSRIVLMKQSAELSYAAFTKTLQTPEALITELLYLKGIFMLQYDCVALYSLHTTSVQVCHLSGHITMVSIYHSNKPSSPLQPLL